MFYFARCINIIFNSLLVQLVKYDVHTTRKIKSIHAVIYHILSLSAQCALAELNEANIITAKNVMFYVAFVCLSV